MKNNYIQKAYINGKFVDSNNKIKSFSPIDNKEIGTVPALGIKDIDLAFEVANASFASWSHLPKENRISYIKKFNEILAKNKEELANIMVLEIAKSKKDSEVEVQRTIDYINETIEWYEKIFAKPSIIDENVHKIKNKVGKFYNIPIGVVLAIAPFNYPVNLSLAKIIPSLITGNTVVFKSASQSSIVGLELAKYFDQAKFPAGVINLVSGKGSEIGDSLTTNKYVQGITFTGSTDVGIRIAKETYMKHLVLELGGKDPALVLDDVDLAKTATLIVKGAFNYSGQRCTAIKRVFVTNKIADQLVEHLKNEILKLKTGNPFDSVDVVPVIGSKELKFVQSLIDDAIKNGAKVVCGNEVVGNNLMKPTLLDHVGSNVRIAWEEPFGPVLPIIRVKNYDEMVELANKSEYGLQASIFAQDKNKAIELAEKLDTGTVNINQPSSRGPDIFPFCGVKNSGFGVQGIVNAMLAMTRVKGIVEND